MPAARPATRSRPPRSAPTEIAKLAERIDDAELNRAKAQLKAHMFMAREQPLSRAEQAAGQVLLFDRLYPTTELAAEVDAVTPADVARLGQRLLAGQAATAVLGAKSSLKAGEAFSKRCSPKPLDIGRVARP
jgi:predicted Zn-dependent peptidase